MSKGPNTSPSQIPAQRPGPRGDGGQSLHLPLLLLLVVFFGCLFPLAGAPESETQAAGGETSDPCLLRSSFLQRVQGGRSRLDQSWRAGFELT